MRATPSVTLRVTNSRPRRSDSWLKSMPGHRVEPEALAIVHGDPVTVDFRDAVRAARIERRVLVLRRLEHLAEHLARAGLIEPRLGGRLAHRFEHARHAERREFARENGLSPRRLHEALCREVVDLVGRGSAHRVDQGVLVEEVGRHELDLVDQMRDPLVGGRGAASNDADDPVAFCQ